MKRPAPFKIIATLALCSPTAVAQTYAGIDSQERWDPAITGGANFVDLRAASVDGDELPDAVVLDGEQLVLIHSPAQHHAYSSFGEKTSAMAIWPGDDSSDRVLASELNRLAVYAYDAANGTFDAGTAIPGPSVAEARKLRIVIDPATNDRWLAGLSGDGMTLFAGRLLSPALYVETLSVTLDMPAHTFDALQWDGQPGLEFLIHDEVGLHLRDSAGAIDPTIAATSSAPNPVLAHFHDTTINADRAFWSTRDQLGDPIGLIMDRRYPPDIEPPLLFTTLNAEEAGFADYDGDGQTDLWFATANTHEAWILYGTVAPSFPGESTFLLDANRTSIFDLSGNAETGILPTVAPLGDVADFDLDGDLDFLFASEDFGHLNFLRGDGVDEEQLVPVLDDYSFTTDEAAGRTYLDFALQVTIPFANYPPQTTLAELRIDAYVQPDLLAEVHAERVGFVTVSLLPQPLGAQLEVPIRLEVTGDPATAIYQFEFRLHDSAGTQAGPARIEFFAQDPGTNFALSEAGNPWSQSSIPFDNTGFHRRSGSGPFCPTCRR